MSAIGKFIPKSGAECRIQKTGLSKSSIYDLIARDQLPRPVRLSPTGGRSVAFVESEIDTWIAERIAARHAE